MHEPLDILAIAAHPDDAELLMGGLLAKTAASGKRAGVLDLTAGEAGSKGSAKRRLREAADAAAIMGLAMRENAALPDAHLENTMAHRLVIASYLRDWKPAIVLIQYGGGRNPDHHAASILSRQAAYSAGLSSLNEGTPGHRPRLVLEAVSYLPVTPSFVVDISDSFETKMKAVRAYASQFDDAREAGDILASGSLSLYEQIELRNREYGARIQVAYGEPYLLREPFGINDPAEILGRSL
ncbi:MAG: bacillithiol biosynthesis deacetylase BshB1 [Gemmatimonadetes bacterium]|nr:bacillithiol biosynthesis deacetylase BshB1 [Gemmatimonadota bacterium]